MDDMSELKDLKVMIIDDSSTIRRSAEVFLSSSNCEVTFASDGFEAMAKIIDNRPDIIFIDIVMPRLDGYQACMLIKKNPHYQSIPIIMLSSKNGLFDKARGRMAGSDDYLTKPFTSEDLLTVMRKYAVRKSIAEQ